MTRRAVARLATVALVAGCGGFVPDTAFGPMVDVPGVGSATAVGVQPVPLGPDGGGFASRWTGARAVVEAEDDQVLVVWTGGPPECWVTTAVHLDARGRALTASIEERQNTAEDRPACRGERTLLAVFIPTFAMPLPGGVSDWPPVR